MIRISLTLLSLVLLCSSCASRPPKVARCDPWYTTEDDLAAKAAAHRRHTQSLLNEQGLLLYRACLPWGNSDEGVWNYRDSHDLADAPAWHGLEMASLAFEWAVTGRVCDGKIQRMADALLEFYDITGVPGVLARCYLADYTGPRLHWMEDPTERPFNYWMQGVGGRWYRKGLAKNHLNLAVFGCAMPLHLDRIGAIHLSRETREKLVAVVVPAVRHLIEGGFRIRDADGTFTRFGDLRPDVTVSPFGLPVSLAANGFNRVLALHLMLSASPYDPEIRRIYDLKARDWAEGIGDSMEVLGELVSWLGRQNYDKPSHSDMAAFGMASMSILLQESRRDVVRSVRRGMTGVWQYMRYEVNPLFTIPYSLIRECPSRIDDVVMTLRRFPMPSEKRFYRFETVVDSSRVQPIHNRPPSSNYWKSSPYRRVAASAVMTPPTPVLSHRTGAEVVYSSQDYNLAYWMGRYVGAVPAR